MAKRKSVSKPVPATGIILGARGKRGVPVEVMHAPKSAELADKGLEDGTQYIKLMAALISDVLTGRIPPQICNAASSTARNIAKMTELQLKYGNTSVGSLSLVNPLQR